MPPLLSCEAVLQGHTETVWHCSWNSRGSLLATCSSDKTIRIWELSLDSLEWICVAVLDGHSRTVRCCEWNPSGKRLCSGSFDGTCAVWEYSTSAKEWEMIATLEGHENEVKSVAWSIGGNFLATCGRDKTVWIWEATEDNEFECLTVLNGHTQDVKFVMWHPSEDLLFSASYDNTIKVWGEDGDDWCCVDTLRGHESTVWGLCFGGAGGKRLLSCSDDRSVILWEWCQGASGSLHRVLGRGRVGNWKSASFLKDYHGDPIYSIEWSRDERGLIFTGCGDNAIHILRESDDASFLQEGVVENAHSGDVNCIRWNPGLGLLASAGDDEVVRIWKVSSVLD